jgi:hypothetical protein
MKVVVPPDLPWVGRHFVCPGCGGIVEFEVTDTKGVPPIKPALISGQWTVRCQCQWCRTVKVFTEQPPVP